MHIHAMRPGAAVPNLVRRIREDILFGRLHPRERLTEDELIARTGATRHAVRSALQALARDGVVVHHPNRGAQVRDFDPAEVEEITVLRATLQAEAARRMPLPASPAVLRQLEQIEAAHAAAVARGDTVAIHREDDRFHDALFAAAGNRYLAAAIRDHAAMLLAFRRHEMADPTLAARARDEHRAILAALRSGDRARLEALCVAHVRLDRRGHGPAPGWTGVAAE